MPSDAPTVSEAASVLSGAPITQGHQPAEGALHVLLSVLEWVADHQILAAALVAGGISLLVGVLTYKGVLAGLENSRRLAADRHAHERETAEAERAHAVLQAQLDRVAKLRKEVYLEACSKLSGVSVFISTLALADPRTPAFPTELRELLAAIARVGIVSEQETAELAREMSQRAAMLYGRLWSALQPAGESLTDVEIYKAEYENTQGEIRRILTERGRAMQEGLVDKAHFDRSQSWIQGLQDLANTYLKSQSEAQLKLDQCRMDVLAMGVQAVPELAALGDRLAAALRKDLGIETDLSAFQQQTASFLADLPSSVREAGEAAPEGE